MDKLKLYDWVIITESIPYLQKGTEGFISEINKNSLVSFVAVNQSNKIFVSSEYCKKI